MFGGHWWKDRKDGAMGGGGGREREIKKRGMQELINVNVVEWDIK